MIILILSLGVYVLATAGLLIRMFNKESPMLFAKQQLMDLPTRIEDSDLSGDSYEEDDDIEFNSGDDDDEGITEAHTKSDNKEKMNYGDQLRKSSGFTKKASMKEKQINVKLPEKFVCDTQNSPDFPDGVIKRSLHGVIIGAMKGG